MSATYRLSPRQATSTGSARPTGQPGNTHAGEAGDPIARLDVLAAHLRGRGWTTYLTAPAGRLASLFVQGPHDRAECGDIIAAPDHATGDWWYWFSWAERITPAHAPRPRGGRDHRGVPAASGRLPGSAGARGPSSRPRPGRSAPAGNGSAAAVRAPARL